MKDKRQDDFSVERDQKARRRAHWAYILAAFLKESPSLCNELEKDLERAGVRTGLDHRQEVEAFAAVLEYVLEEVNVDIEDDLSEFDEHEQGEIVFDRLVSAT